MANLNRGEIDLAGKTLRYTINAICSLEQECGGRPFTDILKGIQGDAISLSDLRAVLWAGLLDKQPETKPEDAGRMIGDLGVPAVLVAVIKAIPAAFPQMEASAKTGPQ